MLRRLAPFALMIAAVAPVRAPLHAELEHAREARSGHAELDCVTRPPQEGIRWVWNGAYCVGLVVGRAAE